MVAGCVGTIIAGGKAWAGSAGLIRSAAIVRAITSLCSRRAIASGWLGLVASRTTKSRTAPICENSAAGMGRVIPNSVRSLRSVRTKLAIVLATLIISRRDVSGLSAWRHASATCGSNSDETDPPTRGSSLFMVRSIPYPLLWRQAENGSPKGRPSRYRRPRVGPIHPGPSRSGRDDREGPNQVAMADDVYNTVPSGNGRYAQCPRYAVSHYEGGDSPSPIEGQSKAEAWCTCMWNETPDASTSPRIAHRPRGFLCRMASRPNPF